MSTSDPFGVTKMSTVTGIVRVGGAILLTIVACGPRILSKFGKCQQTWTATGWLQKNREVSGSQPPSAKKWSAQPSLTANLVMI